MFFFIAGEMNIDSILDSHS